jgi:hypothetical protein
MTFRSDDNGAEEAPPAQTAYAVGYAKPPAEHRFKKGRSGNPNGRPRKPKGPKRPECDTQLAKKYLLEEAYRPVTLREGDQLIQLPAIQAVFRAMGVSAMKGNRYAQRFLTELVQGVEAENRKSELEYLDVAITYKTNWERAIDQARELGEVEPQPIPHPDDIILDFVAGTATVCGPMTKEDKANWDMVLGMRDMAQGLISEFAGKYRTTRSDKRPLLLEAWKSVQKRFDQINDDLPKRYRKELQDRCWLEGASRPGSQRTCKWPGEDF